ncbi:MAG: beta-class carbonic anhydrase [Acidimicrobiia bacterium]
MNAIDTFLESNERYARDFTKGDVSNVPATRAAIVTCMDARIDPARLLGLEEGDAHVIRNAGGFVTDDVIGCLVLSQRLLGTEEIMVIHHTDCAALLVDSDALAAELESETGTRPTFTVESFRDVESSLAEMVSRLEANAFLNRSAIRAFVYEVATGRLREQP